MRATITKHFFRYAYPAQYLYLCICYSGVYSVFSGTPSSQWVLKSTQVRGLFAISVAGRVMGPTVSIATLEEFANKINGCKGVGFPRKLDTRHTNSQTVRYRHTCLTRKLMAAVVVGLLATHVTAKAAQ